MDAVRLFRATGEVDDPSEQEGRNRPPGDVVEDELAPLEQGDADIKDQSDQNESGDEVLCASIGSVHGLASIW